MKKIIIILILFLLFSCRAKKEYIHTTSVDTLKITKIIKVTPKQLNSLVIEEVCDSLGNLKPFQYTIGSGKNKTVLKAKNNVIYLEQNLDSIKQIWLKEYKSSVKTKDVRVEVKVTPKWVYKSLALNLLLLLFIFRKPLLRLVSGIKF